MEKKIKGFIVKNRLKNTVIKFLIQRVWKQREPSIAYAKNRGTDKETNKRYCTVRDRTSDAIFFSK